MLSRSLFFAAICCAAVPYFSAVEPEVNKQLEELHKNKQAFSAEAQEIVDALGDVKKFLITRGTNQTGIEITDRSYYDKKNLIITGLQFALIAFTLNEAFKAGSNYGFYEKWDTGNPLKMAGLSTGLSLGVTFTVDGFFVKKTDITICGIDKNFFGESKKTSLSTTRPVSWEETGKNMAGVAALHGFATAVGYIQKKLSKQNY